jgi:hypothetical protein
LNAKNKKYTVVLYLLKVLTSKLILEKEFDIKEKFDIRKEIWKINNCF